MKRIPLFYAVVIQRPASLSTVRSRNSSTKTRSRRPRFLSYALINDRGEVLKRVVEPGTFARIILGKKIAFSGCPRLGETEGKGEIAELSATRRAIIKAAVREIDGGNNNGGGTTPACYPGCCRGEYFLVAEGGHETLPRKVVWKGRSFSELVRNSQSRKLEPFPMEMAMPVIDQGQKIEISPLLHSEQAKIFKKT